MKSIIYLFLLPLLLLFTKCSSGDNKDNGKGGTIPVTLADPFILNYDNKYYAYGTNADNGIEVYISDNLQKWQPQNKLALSKLDSWGDRWFWAPEVYYVPQYKKFFMYYSADEHICVATSDSPVGPFVQDEKVPMIPTEKSIDNSLFVDTDGTPYMYYVRFNNGNNIWVAKLENDYKTIVPGTETPCIHVTEDWEKDRARVAEGPFVIKHKNTYYLIYSANDYQSPNYGIGYATSDSPMGPWTKYPGNPIYQKPGSLVGVGHSALFYDKDGNLKIVFHAHYNQNNVQPRVMYISDVKFSDDEIAVLEISPDYMKQTLAQ